MAQRSGSADECVLRHPETAEKLRLPRRLPLLPLRDAVIFPRTTVPLYVGRRASLHSLDAAAAGDNLLVAVAQRRAECEKPGREDLHAVGTIARVLQSYPMADGTRRVLLEGLCPARIGEIGALGAAITHLPLKRAAAGDEAEALAARAKAAFRECLSLDRRIPREAWLGIEHETDPVTVAFRICAHLRVRPVVRQRLLECGEPPARLRLLLRVLTAELDGLQAGLWAGSRRCGAAQGGVGSRGGSHACPAGGSRKRPAAKPGGGVLPGAADPGAGESEEIEELARAAEAAHLPAPAAERARRELARLRRTLPLSPEATVSRNYLDWLLALPWRGRTRDRNDLARAEAILDEDHFGLRKVKERILELIAVLKLSRRVRGSILCLVGPPGVGKTSLGRSIARALGRRFVRMSLGGVRDEAEIRGHRRTYVGSLPGRILQAMRRAGSINPVILLDEVDKLGRDVHGDPAAALLEVLDPEQNCAFNDHYLEIDYDLSRVLFIATANVLEAIPPALRDRLEVIHLPGYLESEKLEIARRFLLPRQMAANGLEGADLHLPDDALARLIGGYTREAGVRGLEREIARLCRRLAKLKAGARDSALEALPGAGNGGTAGLGITIGAGDLDRILGVAPHDEPGDECPRRVGVAMGLAWTSAGGEVLTVEAGVLRGRGRLLLTGQLGTQMRESAQATLSCIRSRAHLLGLPEDFHHKVDIHVHLPKGAIPKDGPSAGVAIALALVSALTGIPTRPEVALSGETTLRGAVLPVGGLAEKLMAARRAGARVVLLPHGNEKHVGELPEEVREGLEVRFVRTIDEVLTQGLAGRLPRAAKRARRTTPSASARHQRAAA